MQKQLSEYKQILQKFLSLTGVYFVRSFITVLRVPQQNSIEQRIRNELHGSSSHIVVSSYFYAVILSTVYVLFDRNCGSNNINRQPDTQPSNAM